VKRLAPLACVLALLSCKRAPEPAPPAKPAPARISQQEDHSIAETVLDIDSDNLLNMGYGAALVSRTGEQNLENAAVQAIDGFEYTSWTSPP
jgi:hypothetical protein